MTASMIAQSMTLGQETARNGYVTVTRTESDVSRLCCVNYDDYNTISCDER